MDFKFNGDWHFLLKLEKLAHLNSDELYPLYKEDSQKGMVSINIRDVLDEDPDPLIEQINTIHYIQMNQDAILKALLEAVRSAYIIWKEIDGEEYDTEENYPILNDVSDLRKAIALNEIEIATETKDGFAYAHYYFGCSWEREHGFAVTFHKDRFIVLGCVGDLSYREVCEDNGTDYEESIRLFNFQRPLKYYTPNPKYGKLKPTQESVNDSLPSLLIRQGLTQQFIDLIEEGRYNVDYQNSYKMGISLLSIACGYDNEELVRYILSKEPTNYQDLKSVKDEKYKEQINDYLLTKGQGRTLKAQMFRARRGLLD